MIRNALAWIDDRTGLPALVRDFFEEDIPASSGWHQVFGSVAMFLFMTQMFTGILLAFNYAPTPGEAYNSLKYILTEVTGGRLIRGLHHWGASMMIVVVVLHMVQVLVYGAYKKPREGTWMAGLILLQLVLVYGLTGYLLPWDNRAYWGTVVATQIASHVPLAGPYLSRLLGGEGSIGVVTFARFYALHVLLLPPATLGLIALHVFLVRKHGVMPLAGDTAPKKKFWPGQVFKDTVAIFVCFAILFTLAIAARVPLERLADPTDTSYVPRPDWYFLFLFQTLKFFEGPLEVIGTVVLPGLATLALFLIPFFDRGPVVRVAKRTTAMAGVVLAGLCWGGLTAAAIATTPRQVAQTFDENEGPQDWQPLSPTELAGIGYFRQESCTSCHTLGKAGASEGPDLAAAKKHDAAWMVAHFKQPAQVRPGSSMPPSNLSNAQLNTLAAFLLKLTPANAATLGAAPQKVVEGAMVYVNSRCGACHQVNGSGMKLGPALNGLSGRRSRDWVEQHFADPQKLSPGTSMPPYKFSSKELDRIMEYLYSIPG